MAGVQDMIATLASMIFAEPPRYPLAIGLPDRRPSMRTASAPTTIGSRLGPTVFLVRRAPAAPATGPSPPRWRPASAPDIERLPQRRIEQTDRDNADTKACAVCQEEFGLGDLATTLPCAHLFHGRCIEPWLARNGTCPLCRMDVRGPQEDPPAARAQAAPAAQPRPPPPSDAQPRRCPAGPTDLPRGVAPSPRLQADRAFPYGLRSGPASYRPLRQGLLVVRWGST
uniref:RING-type domain-containing protein n=1 Tax=Eutreptiella gymnastica TaxID=73025 RepID=A0A7S4CRU0_9EUGL